MASTPTLPKASLCVVLLFLSLFCSSVVGDHADFVPGEIVEKKFSFLGKSGPPVEDLGHHAGYYSLPRSKASR